MKINTLMRRLRLAVLALLSWCGINATAARPSSVPTDEQRGLTIYQVMVASFRHSPDGAQGYSAMWGPDGHTKNGNLRGITEALDHIASLGVNAIWLTPVFDSSNALGGEKLQATGYFTNDFVAIDPHFGTEADFRELVDEAHRRGLYVILDGVFGHHGGVTTPSPSGHVLDTREVFSDRGEQGGTGNIRYPGSLDYIKEVATYYIDRYGIDGWRLDQAYQATQGGHNYWNEIRRAVEDAAAARRERGERWGTLGYMVGEDWGTPDVINRGVYRDGGLLSAFDFDGKELISGPMQDVSGAPLEIDFDNIRTVLSPPSSRGYLSDNVIPNLFLSNHDGYRVADHFADDDSLRYRKLMTLNGVLAAYSGPVTLYYGDEYADVSAGSPGAQKDNIARTSGHLEPRNDNERQLRDFIAHAMTFRRNHPAMWRGEATFRRFEKDGADVLVVLKNDPETSDNIAVVFADGDVTLDFGPGAENVAVRAYIPQFVVLEPER